MLEMNLLGYGMMNKSLNNAFNYFIKKIFFKSFKIQIVLPSNAALSEFDSFSYKNKERNIKKRM